MQLSIRIKYTGLSQELLDVPTIPTKSVEGIDRHSGICARVLHKPVLTIFGVPLPVLSATGATFP